MDESVGQRRITDWSEFTTAGCWQWFGRIDRDGYGRLSLDGVRWLAHRLAYEAFVGAIPAGMEVDHICFNPGCVNPEHLQVLTPSENRRRQRSALKSHCKNGHEFTPENTYLRPKCRKGQRSCRRCGAEASSRYLARKRAAA